MNKTCKQCGVNFDQPDSRDFLRKFSLQIKGEVLEIPESSLCNDCRHQRIYALRNEMALYHRKCDMCQTSIISMFPPENKCKIYCKKCWWSDKWNPLDYGREYDFNRPFFDQFNELIEKVPFGHLIIGGAIENCDYTNYMMTSKNCYLVSSSDYDEDCYYSTYIFRSKDCFDCLFVNDSELLYQCIDTTKCYKSVYLQDCNNCSECSFCYGLKGCQDCIGCVGLHNQKYRILNEQYSKEEYEEKKKEFFISNKNYELLLKQFLEFKLRFPHKCAEIENCISSDGDRLTNCKDVHNCFDLMDANNCLNVSLGLKARDCMDCIGVPNSDLCYQSCASPEDYSIQFSAVTWPKSTFLQYCMFCRMSNNCFGCVSTYKNEYCILNKQYTKEEYEELLPRIIEHMKKSGEYGDFFPVSISPFAYNETVANDFYPITQEEVTNKGWRWYEDLSEKMYKGPIVEIPDNISDVSEEICKKILICTNTSKPYKIIPQELSFYKKMGIPVPKECPNQRHKDRMKLRNPRKLWDRNCAKCQKSLKTSFSPNRPEIVYCEECYLKEMY